MRTTQGGRGWAVGLAVLALVILAWALFQQAGRTSAADALGAQLTRQEERIVALEARVQSLEAQLSGLAQQPQPPAPPVAQPSVPDYPGYDEQGGRPILVVVASILGVALLIALLTAYLRRGRRPET